MTELDYELLLRFVRDFVLAHRTKLNYSEEYCRLVDALELIDKEETITPAARLGSLCNCGMICTCGTKG